MGYIYLDTSVLGAYYTPERKSQTVDAALRNADADNTWLISSLVETELVSALARKRRDRILGDQDVMAVLEVYEEDLKRRFHKIQIVIEIHQTAQELLLRTRYPARALDALHIATAISVANGQYPIELWTADSRMAEIAREQKLDVRFF